MRVPLGLARCGDLLGMDHILNQEKAIDVFYRTICYTRALSLSYEDIQCKSVLFTSKKT